MRLGGLLRASSDQAWGHLLDFALQGFKDFIYDLLVIGQVGFEPLECLGLVGIAAFVYELLEFFKLLVGHLVSQIGTDAQFQRFVDMLEHCPLLVFRQSAQTKFVKKVVIEF